MARRERESRDGRATGRTTRIPEVRLAAWGFGLNALWEFTHSPLYADHDRGVVYVVWTRLHCTAGDVLILLVCFWLVALFFRSRRWHREWPVRGGATFTVAGMAYTVWSEWLNTGIKGAWSYSESMPTVLGIGLTPVLQWLVIPPLLVRILVITGRVSSLRERPG